MIITISGANFSASNIGTLSTWTVSKSIGAGAEHSIPSYVDKNSAFNYTITLKDGYTFGTYSVTMGGQTITPTVTETSITINIPSVTGAVRIEVKTINSSTGEEDKPVTPEEPGTGGDDVALETFTVTWEAGNIDTNTGKLGTTANRRRTVEYIPVKYKWGCVTTLISDPNVHVIFYDKDYKYVAPTSTTTTTFITVSKNNAFFNLLQYMPNDAEYFKIMARTGDESQDTNWLPIRNIPIVDANIVEWKTGGISVATGVDDNSENATGTGTAGRRRTSYIHASKKYVTVTNTVNIHVVFYDIDGNYLGTTKNDNGTYSFLTISPNTKTNVLEQAPENTVLYRIVSRTYDTAQDNYYTFNNK